MYDKITATPFTRKPEIIEVSCEPPSSKRRTQQSMAMSPAFTELMPVRHNCQDQNMGIPYDQVLYVHIGHEPEPFVFNNKARVYDFTRTAKAKIRAQLVSFLSSGVLPQPVDVQSIQREFDRLFNLLNYPGYKGFLNDVGQELSEWLKMQIPVMNGVAHVYLDSTSTKTGPKEFQVRVHVEVKVIQICPLPGTSLPALTSSFPSNPLSMTPNGPSLMNSNRRAQELIPTFGLGFNSDSVPMNFSQGFY